MALLSTVVSWRGSRAICISVAVEASDEAGW